MLKQLSAATFIVLTGAIVNAQTVSPSPSEHQMHMANMAADTRQQLEFPAPMKAHMLSNMRDHLQVISQVIDAMSRGR